MTWEVDIDVAVSSQSPGASGGVSVKDDGTIYSIVESAIYLWNGTAWESHIGGALGGYGLTYSNDHDGHYYIYDNDGEIWGYINNNWHQLEPPGGVDLTHGRALAIGDEDSDYDLYYLNVDECVCIYGANLSDDGEDIDGDWVRLTNVLTADNLIGGMAVKGNFAYLVRSPEFDTTDRFGIEKRNLKTDQFVERIGPATRGLGLAFDGNDLLRLGVDGKVYRFESFIKPLLDTPRRLTGEDLYYALEITHADFSGEGWPIRVVADSQNHTIDGNEYIALAFRAQPPNFQDGEEPTAILEIDNVGRVLTERIDESKGGRGAKMKVMQVRRGKRSSEIVWEMPALPIGVTSVTNERIQVSLSYRNARARPAIKWRHTAETSPGLY